ncbi:MAG: ribonuclease H family protein [Butyrivibrio sp.]|nr:ribonuclease H family protein [Butyrivibrio sp.]
MAQKFYAVRKGKKAGIYNSWDECKAQVDGFSGAEYKSFKTKEEALTYMGEEVCNTKKDPDGVIAYVDGSFNIATKEFSYGMVILRDSKEFTFNKKFYDEELSSMRNVAGEIKGAEAAMRYAIDEGLSEITIYYDYAGIANWCLGAWKTNKEGTIAYKAYYDSIKDKVRIYFEKVKGHSGDKYNDMADELAKKALGIL